MKPYIIISPLYNPTSGGVKVLYGLYGWLLAKGCEAYVNAVPNGKDANDMIAIYPEIESSNPVKTNKIMRYVLNTPGIMRGYDKDGKMLEAPTDFTGEHVYYFSRMFGEGDYLFLPAISLQVFKDLGKRRTKTCYLVGKGKNKHKHPEGSIELNREVARDQIQLNEILNECKEFYCYDDLTAMMEVARLAGVPYTRYYGKYDMETLKMYEPGLNGITGKLDTEKFRDHYTNMIRIFEGKLEKFIEESQQW